MFSYLRFFLATLVLMSHLGIKLWRLDLGVMSVVLFFMLAGYVVTDLLTRVFEPDKKLILRFYGERCLRIFPLYLYCLSLTVAFLLLTSFGDPVFNPIHLLSNALIIPLDYFMFFDNSILQHPNSSCLVSWFRVTSLPCSSIHYFIKGCQKYSGDRIPYDIYGYQFVCHPTRLLWLSVAAINAFHLYPGKLYLSNNPFT
jgi:hypothetical protein